MVKADTKTCPGSWGGDTHPPFDKRSVKEFLVISKTAMRIISHSKCTERLSNFPQGQTMTDADGAEKETKNRLKSRE